MPDLFPESETESLSPKLAWLKKHRLMTKEVAGLWLCQNAGQTYSTCAETEAEAILGYCEKYSLKHWTLE